MRDGRVADDAEAAEEELVGDGVTPGIVRIGDTVRRPARPFTATVQAYLAHLHEAGFHGAPLPLGLDEEGREVLSFVPGDVPREPLPPEATGEDVLAELARLVRSLHDASAGWTPLPGAVWGAAPRDGEEPEVVVHGDYCPGNVVFRDGLPVALIDFDLARPAPRLYDIFNAVYWWAPLFDPLDRAPSLAGADIPHRVAVFADAYGMTTRQRRDLAPFAEAMIQHYHRSFWAAAQQNPAFRRLWDEDFKHRMPRAEAWIKQAAPLIAARLTVAPPPA
jgi:aminoglycoside phosphotransferase (APT) family kinase protein